MVLDLASMKVRLGALLNDPAGEIWPDIVLEECIRMGLRELQMVCPYPLTLSGLDEALVSNLDDEVSMSPLLLRLSLVYAWQIRQQQRNETFHPDPKVQEGTLLIASNVEQLERLRLSFLQRSTSNPYLEEETDDLS